MHGYVFVNVILGLTWIQPAFAEYHKVRFKSYEKDKARSCFSTERKIWLLHCCVWPDSSQPLAPLPNILSYSTEATKPDAQHSLELGSRGKLDAMQRDLECGREAGTIYLLICLFASCQQGHKR